LEASITKTKGLTSNSLKLIAIAAMLIDHIAWGFLPFGSVLAQVMHIIGRITAPIMFFFIAEGYYRTRNIKKYAIRLGIFALISYLPYVIFQAHSWPPDARYWGDLNVIYTLFLSLLALWAWDKIENEALRILTVVGLCILSIPGDWTFFGVLYTLAFGIHHGDFKEQAKWFSIITIIMVILASIADTANHFVFYKDFFQLGVLLALPLLSMYNGERGGGKYGKWIFYIFYPAHLLILAVLAILIK
jgi:hypothetical protein